MFNKIFYYRELHIKLKININRSFERKTKCLNVEEENTINLNLMKR